METLELIAEPVRRSTSPDIRWAIRPAVKVRPMNPSEMEAAHIWFAMNGKEINGAEIAEYSNGAVTHAPEVIAEYRTACGWLPPRFALIYAHRGVQANCVHPLLPSLLNLTDHKGPSFAIRQHAGQTDTDLNRFVQAITAGGMDALVIEDQQTRVGPAASLQSAPVHISIFNGASPTCTTSKGAI